MPWLATEDILKLAVAEDLLTLAEARTIWGAMMINDPKRQIL
ncbi:MAG TPA: hypothetical protein VIO35_03225 [Chloroflexota bacterium]